MEFELGSSVEVKIDGNWWDATIKGVPKMDIDGVRRGYQYAVVVHFPDEDNIPAVFNVNQIRKKTTVTA